MEELKQPYKIILSQKGDLNIQSPNPLTAQEIQPLTDAAILQQKAHLQHQKEIDKQHQVYTLLISFLLFIGLFSVSFAGVRTISKNFKSSEVNYARQLIS